MVKPIVMPRASTGPGDGIYALAELLRERVRSGHYSADGRLPDEFVLIKELGVSRTRLRAAMEILKREGIVLRRRGHGTFAARPRLRYSPRRSVGFAAALAMHDLAASHEVLSASTRAMDPLSADEFKVQPGTPLHVIERLSHLADEPILFSAYVVRGDLAPAMLRPEYANRGADMRDWLSACSVMPPAAVDICVEAVVADAHVAGHLRCAEGMPALRVNRRFYTADDELLAYGSATMRGDRFTYEIPRQFLTPERLSGGQR